MGLNSMVPAKGRVVIDDTAPSPGPFLFRRGRGRHLHYIFEIASLPLSKERETMSHPDRVRPLPDERRDLTGDTPEVQ